MKSLTTLGVNWLVPTYIPYNNFKYKLGSQISCRYYSTSNSDSNSESSDSPIPILTFNDLSNSGSIKSYRKLLKDKGGIYSFINLENGN